MTPASSLSAPSTVAPSGDGATVVPKTRNNTLDGLKYLAACALVLHHAAARTGDTLGSFLVAAMVWALIFFFAVAGYFHGATGTRGRAWLGKRLVRLGVPYAFWSLIYLLIGQPGALLGEPLTLPNLYHTAFFAGAHGILWSLPMLFYSAVVAELFARDPLHRRIAIGVCLLGVFALDWSATLQALTAGPLQNFWYAPRWIAAYLLGMEFRALGKLKPPTPLVRSLVPLSIIAAGALRVYGGVFPQGWPELTSTLLWAATVFILLWGATSGVAWAGASRLAWGGSFLIGIYITHIIWLDVFNTLVRVDQLPAPIWILSAWAFSLAAATLITVAMRRTKFTSPLIS